MTSGKFKSYPVDQIWVERELRQRRELKGIEELAASIAEIGLINPLTIKMATGELVAGERRWTAVKQLGWTHVSVQFIENLNEEEVHLIELEENIRRVDITWQEQCLALDRYHEMKKAKDPKWSEVQTAQTLGLSQPHINERLAVAKELKKGNAKVTTATKYSTAKDVVKRSTERAKVQAKNSLLGIHRPERPLIHADFLKWSKTYDGPKFNLIHCDFPYGQKHSHKAQKIGRVLGSYEDTADIYWALLECLSDSMERICAESAHIVFWFSMHLYTETKKVLEDMGWELDPFPLIWKKNAGGLPDPNRKPFRKYETAFFGSFGDRKIVTAVDNIFDAPSTKAVHMSEKSLPMLKHFFRMIVDGNSYVLDPTAGSGNALKAAEALGAKYVLGLEKEGEFYERAVDLWES